MAIPLFFLSTSSSGAMPTPTDAAHRENIQKTLLCHAVNAVIVNARCRTGGFRFRPPLVSGEFHRLFTGFSAWVRAFCSSDPAFQQGLPAAGAFPRSYTCDVPCARLGARWLITACNDGP